MGSLIPTERALIPAAVPLSAGVYYTALTDTAATRVKELEAAAQVDYDQVAGNWRLQLGSLGSGNHFIEVTRDEQDRVWPFLHSGSRGIGNKLDGKHIAVAQKLCRSWGLPLPRPGSDLPGGGHRRVHRAQTEHKAVQGVRSECEARKARRLSTSDK